MGFFFSQLKATEGNFHKASNKRIDNCQIPRLAPSIPIFEARKEQVPNLKADCPGSIHQVKKKMLQTQDSPLHNDERVDHVLLFIFCLL